MSDSVPEPTRDGWELYAQRMRFLAEAGKRLAGSLDYQTTLRTVADLAVPAIADWCVVYLTDDAGELRRLALAHADPAVAEVLERLSQRYPEAPDPPYRVKEVVRTGEPRWVPQVGSDEVRAAARDDAHHRVLERLDVASCIVVPLATHALPFGALSLVRSSSSPPYDVDDFAMAQELAARAALAIDNARLVASLEQTQQHLEQSATELEAQAEELQTTVEELESTTGELLRTNDELARAKAAAETAQAVAEEANEAKSQFLATMSHELRTPLNAIDGYAELLEMGIHGPVTPQQREALRRLRRAQKRLLSLINDVLNFAKLEAGQVVVERARVNVNELLADIEAIITPQVADKGQTLVTESASADLEILADVRKAEQILVNLLSNAVKFTPSGGQIRVTVGSEGEMATITVSDTGNGIPADRLRTVFEPFVQLQSGLVRDHGGVGLGLSISRELAQRMDGDLRADSREGVGSRFMLLLPLAGAADRARADHGDAARAAQSANDPGSGSGAG